MTLMSQYSRPSQQIQPVVQQKQALVMLDSYNSFMEPLNKDIQECFLPIGNIPLLDILIHHLHIQKIDHIIFGISKTNKSLEDFIGKHRYAKFIKLTSQVVTGNNAIQAIANLFENSSIQFQFPLLIINGPIVTNMNFEQLYADHEAFWMSWPIEERIKFGASLVMQPVQHDSLMRSVHGPFITQYLETGQIVAMDFAKEQPIFSINLKKQKQAKCKLSTQHQLSHIYLVNQVFVNNIKTRADSELTTVFEFLSHCLKLDDNMILMAHMQKSTELSVRIDCPRSYKGVNRTFLLRYFQPYCQGQNIFYKNEKKIVQIPYFNSSIGTGFYIKDKSHLKGVCIIGNNNKIWGQVSGSILGDDVQIGNNSQVIDSILFDGVIIKDGCYVKNAVIMGNCTLHNGSILPSGSIIGNRVSQITPTLIEHSIRATYQALWGEQLLQSIYFDENDKMIFQQFIAGNVKDLGKTVICKLPPIYITSHIIEDEVMRHYMDACDFYFQRAKDFGSDTPISLEESRQQFTYLRVRLDQVKYLRNHTEEEDEENPTDFQEAPAGIESSDEMLSQQIINKITSKKQTVSISQYYIPKFVITKAKQVVKQFQEENPESTNEQIVAYLNQAIQPWFLEIQQLHGFQADNIQIIESEQVNNEVDFDANSAFKDILKLPTLFTTQSVQQFIDQNKIDKVNVQPRYKIATCANNTRVLVFGQDCLDLIVHNTAQEEVLVSIRQQLLNEIVQVYENKDYQNYYEDGQRDGSVLQRLVALLQARERTLGVKITALSQQDRNINILLFQAELAFSAVHKPYYEGDDLVVQKFYDLKTVKFNISNLADLLFKRCNDCGLPQRFIPIEADADPIEPLLLVSESLFNLSQLEYEGQYFSSKGEIEKKDYFYSLFQIFFELLLDIKVIKGAHLQEFKEIVTEAIQQNCAEEQDQFIWDYWLSENPEHEEMEQVL